MSLQNKVERIAGRMSGRAYLIISTTGIVIYSRIRIQPGIYSSW